MIYQTAHGKVILGDCMDVMAGMRSKSVDLVVGSPPYEDQREYEELKFTLQGEDWVRWMFGVVVECVRVCRGLVCLVIGHGKGGCRRWTGTPALLTADLIRAGICLRNPFIYKRQGIMGSGHNDWLRADYEWTICATHDEAELPWSDNTARGHPPKCGPGGPPSHRSKNGKRVGGCRTKDGTRDPRKFYKAPELSNPGNVLDCGVVGGGRIGSDIAHLNEAPYPERVPDFVIASFCPPDGLVLDPFSGSGTTAGEAVKLGRKFIAIDKRQSQVDLTLRRVKSAERQRGFLLT